MSGISLLLAELAGGLGVHFLSWQHLVAADRLGKRNSATTVRFSTSCWLLVTLTTTTALAQTHPKKKPARKPALVQRLHRNKQEPTGKPFRTQDIYEDFTSIDAPTEPATLNPNPVYTYVEQMPTLNGQHALFASTAAITRSVVVPADAPAGRVFVQFIVTKAGMVSQPHVIKGLRADVDSAVVAATRKLPRFTPGNQNGQVVAVSLTLPVTFPVKKQP